MKDNFFPNKNENDKKVHIFNNVMKFGDSEIPSFHDFANFYYTFVKSLYIKENKEIMTYDEEIEVIKEGFLEQKNVIQTPTFKKILKKSLKKTTHFI